MQVVQTHTLSIMQIMHDRADVCTAQFDPGLCWCVYLQAGNQESGRMVFKVDNYTKISGVIR